MDNIRSGFQFLDSFGTHDAAVTDSRPDAIRQCLQSITEKQHADISRFPGIAGCLHLLLDTLESLKQTLAMMQVLPILFAIVLAFPMGLFEHHSPSLECSGSTFVIEEVSLELLEIASPVHSDSPNLYLSEKDPFAGRCLLVSRATLDADFVAIEMRFVELLDCRPPPSHRLASLLA